jgi:hypothetical protein
MLQSLAQGMPQAGRSLISLLITEGVTGLATTDITSLTDASGVCQNKQCE